MLPQKITGFLRIRKVLLDGKIRLFISSYPDYFSSYVHALCNVFFIDESVRFHLIV